MKFKESPLVKNHKILTGTKRDMRKKVVKSTTPTSDLKKPTTLKRQLGGNIFTTYNSITPYEGPVFEQPVATVEIEELPINRLEANRQNVMAKAEEKKEEPVVEEKVNTEPLPTSKEETPIVESKESTPINIKSKDEFIKTMTPAFENALKAKGLDTKYAKYLVAQSALESNWGKSQSGKFNFGGIKGKGTIRKTREVINGKSIHINDSFRDFKDINDYANYHVSLLNNKRYQAFSGGDFIDRVVKGGYATDPNYKKALSNVYNQIAKAQEGMKIPKLKGAGELRNRILRQFNREKAANRNEEQLIGFDWSRYKSNKPKPETTPTQSEQLENGGVIKAQDGIVTQAINKVKSFLPKEEPKEPINVVDVAKEYAPSAVASMLLGNINPFVSKLLEGKKPSLDYSHKFGSTGNKFEEFASVMTPIFKEALEENGLPTTNLNNLVRQAALESNYGLDPRGERGFNLSGIKHPGDSIAPKYKKSRYKDGFDYIDFDNLKDYANYKVKVLNDRYKALDAKDTNDFIDRLHGNNSGKYNYSADKDSYRRNLNGTLSLNKYLKRGGIIKYQNPSSGIQRRDAIKDYRPQIQEPIKQQYTPTYSEISQDNRSEWEKEVSRQIKADKAKNDKLYGNQHTWNWSAPFTNTRITKDNASTMFDFNKSAAMSTFATGIGVANPVATATSMAGSLVGAGIGNKIAGNKGALIGGFVGGMVNPNIRFGKSSSTRHQKYGSLNDINIHSKMNFDNYNQIMNKIKEEENLYRLYLQNKTVADRINKVAPSYRDAVDEFTKSGIKTKLGQPDKNFNAVNKVADDVEPSLGGVPFKHQENVYNLKPGETIIDLEPVAHENSHGIDRAMSSLMSTDYLKTLLNPNDKLPFHKWIQRATDNKSIVDYVKQIRGLDMNNPADYPQIEKQIYNYFSKPTEIKAYFSRIPFEKYKKSVDRSFDGKIINNPVSEDIFQITDADILNDVRLQLIASIYGRNKAASYEALKSNLTNKIWGISALGIPTINTLINGYE